MTNEFLPIPTSIIFFIIDAIRGVMSAMAAMMAAKRDVSDGSDDGSESEH